MSLLEELYSEDLIGDPETLDEREETDGPLFVEDEANERNDDDAENDHISQTVPQSDNPVQPKKKRVVKNPQPKLDAERLKGPRGLTALENMFKDYKFCGQGYEKRDLDQVMKRLEHWAHRLFPKYQFDDCLEKIETLGHKKPVMVYVKKIRMGLETAESSAIEPLTEDNDDLALPLDPFDELLSQQLSEIHASQSVGMSPQNITPTQHNIPISSQPTKIVLTEEQRKRMERNRLIAQERRLARLKALQESQEQNEGNPTSEIVEVSEKGNDEIQARGGLEEPVQNEENSTSEIIDLCEKGNDEIEGREGLEVPEQNEGNSPSEIIDLCEKGNDEIQTWGGLEVPVQNEGNPTSEIIDLCEKGNEIQARGSLEVPVIEVELELNETENSSLADTMKSVPLTVVSNPEMVLETVSVNDE